MIWLTLAFFLVAISCGVSINPLENLILEKDRSSGIKSNVICGLCSFAVDHLISKRRDFKYSDNNMDLAMNTICVLVTRFLNYEGICRGFVKINLKPILYIIDNSNANGADACSVLLQNYNCVSKRKATEWNVEISPKDRTKTKCEVKARPVVDQLRILHITDIHYDSHYSVNRTLPCKRPLCCQDDDKFATNNEIRSGYWTDYSKCDVPSYLIEETFKFIKENIKFDYIYFTGDIINHSVIVIPLIDLSN